MMYSVRVVGEVVRVVGSSFLVKMDTIRRVYNKLYNILNQRRLLVVEFKRPNSKYNVDKYALTSPSGHLYSV